MFRNCCYPARSFVRAASALFVVVPFVTACSSEGRGGVPSASLSEAIVGKWINTDETFEFFDGGRALLSFDRGGKTKSGAEYEFLSDDRIYMRLDGASPQELPPFDLRVSIEDGKLELCEEGRVSSCIHFLRVESDISDEFYMRMEFETGELPYGNVTLRKIEEAKNVLRPLAMLPEVGTEERVRHIQRLRELPIEDLRSHQYYYGATLVRAEGDDLCIAMKPKMPTRVSFIPDVSIDASYRFYYTDDCS